MLDIDTFIEWVRSTDGPISVVWNRTGQSILSLLDKDSWTPLAIFGINGHIKIKSTDDNISRLSCGYEIEGSDVIIRPDPFTLEAFASGFEKPCELAISSINPISSLVTYWTIWTTFQEISSLVWPTMDITVGNQLCFTANYNASSKSVDIIFTNSTNPNIKLVELLTYNLTVNRLTINRNSIDLSLSGSYLKKTKTFTFK